MLFNVSTLGANIKSRGPCKSKTIKFSKLCPYDGEDEAIEEVGSKIYAGNIQNT